VTATLFRFAHAARKSRRPPFSRLFALLVALLMVAMQPRAVALSAPLGGTASRIVKHAERIEHNALRVDSAACIAAAVLARAPSLPALLSAWRWPSARLALGPPAATHGAQPLTHFHSKRRIPRMNSDEPPRA
jgi:hypothetical protein